MNLILVVGFIGYAHLRRSFSGTPLIRPVSRFLVASRPLRDLLLCAKYLFFAARACQAEAQGRTMKACSANCSADARPIESCLVYASPTVMRSMLMKPCTSERRHDQAKKAASD